MSARRFPVPDLPAVGATFVLPPETRRHVEVLRLPPGTPLVLFDGAGREADAVLLEGGAARVEALRERVDPGRRVVLVQALPKGGKADEIVRMATELGVAAIHFVETARTVPRLQGPRAAKKRARWSRIAEEAARQSERATVPTLAGPEPLEALLDAPPEGAARLVAWARQDARGWPAPDAEAWIAVGPEGGFAPAELEAFDRAGWGRVSLGAHVLRVDTAAVCAVALLRAGAELVAPEAPAS
ncbi:MAG TPA: RsmE family RNA methyltransferase [Polyangiaceae bacterium LLY-WYZ-15_(1-7)]|nr:16S rRNA (uracil(1498)-N(3))-methyltransferase [Sandaracinus sp.]HJL06809.1 RsmE family RNA methyltransferase [Polyangiaceae bacterium LLY-WYZ-15_(1-7)]HJL12617.1 RsmE family RNA methyltransferase [Polyangiaceae bacterium LLY-WYZ-15_(1-7)]